MTGFVLAGGRSSRMGADKARIPFPGSDPMALTVAAALATVGPVAIVRHEPDDWPIPVIADHAPDRHPLWGVAAALRCAGDRAMVAPCDVPWLSIEDVRRLWDARAVATCGGRLHPLLGVFPASLADRAAALAADGAPASALADGLPRIEVDPRSVQQVNRWSDTGRPYGPVEALLRRLPWADADRVAAGEVARLAARGAVDPTYQSG